MSVATSSVLFMDQLTDDDKAILDFEVLSWTYPGAKESAIVERFGMLSVRYYQVLNALIDRPEAQAYSPLLVKRLRRLRDARSRQRSARRLGFVEA
jgi:hypothetical protein